MWNHEKLNDEEMIHIWHHELLHLSAVNGDAFQHRQKVTSSETQMKKMKKQLRRRGQHVEAGGQ